LLRGMNGDVERMVVEALVPGWMGVLLKVTESEDLIASNCARYSRSIVGKSQVGLWVNRVTARLTTRRGGEMVGERNQEW
jgi:hypothetical protein